MAIFITLIIIMIGASTLLSIVSIINPFTEELGNIQRYNMAYYGAIASVERAELVLRNHVAGFEGSGGFINKTTYGNSSDYNSDTINWKYWRQLSLTGLNNGIFWKITNMTKGTTVPNVGEGDLDPDISSGNNYYKLTYDKSLQFAFYKDESSESNYYTGYSSLTDITITDKVQVSIRAPWKLVCKYNGKPDNCVKGDVSKILDENNSIDLDGDEINDDIIVNRSIFGYSGDTQFTIFPSINVSGSSVEDDDTAIRESTINDYLNKDYNVNYDTNAGNDYTNPSVNTTDIDKFNQSPEDTVLTGFDKIFNGSDTKQINLKFSLVNLLKYSEDEIYPYLVLKLDAGIKLPDFNFNILGEGKAGEYDVKIMFKKPIFNSTAASDFTVLF